ncbi:MAG: MoaD/ThiS family protein [Flavobacteriaceae bacterium]
MKLHIKYFGLLTEVTKCTEEIIDFSGNTIQELLQVLITKYPELENKDFQIAQNNELVSKETLISNPEIALLPPFSGG